MSAERRREERLDPRRQHPGQQFDPVEGRMHHVEERRALVGTGDTPREALISPAIMRSSSDAASYPARKEFGATLESEGVERSHSR